MAPAPYEPEDRDSGGQEPRYPYQDFYSSGGGKKSRRGGGGGLWLLLALLPSKKLPNNQL